MHIIRVLGFEKHRYHMCSFLASDCKVVSWSESQNSLELWCLWYSGFHLMYELHYYHLMVP